MPCLLGCLALITPRFVIILVAIFSNYLGQAYDNVLLPIIGFIFLPLTTLAYAWAWHQGNGQIQGLGIVAIVIAVLFDLGLIGASEKSRRASRRD